MVTDFPTGYSVILPPGWLRIPVSDAVAESVEEFLDLKFGSADLGKREVASAHLAQVIAEARNRGVLDLFIPWLGAPVLGGGATFAVSTVLRSADFQPVLDHSACLSQGSRLSRVSIDGVCSLRRERDHRTDPTGPSTHLRLVDYFLPVPNQTGRWVIATSATIIASDSPGDAPNHLVDLFDSIMSTFRWERPSNVS